MGFGLNKPTAIFFILSVVMAVGTRNWKNGAVLFGVFAVCMIIWKVLTK